MLPLPFCVLASHGHARGIDVSDVPVDKNSLTYKMDPKGLNKQTEWSEELTDQLSLHIEASEGEGMRTLH